VLSGEAGGRQVLGGRRTAHRHRDIPAVLGFKLSIGCDDILTQRFGTGGGVNDRPRLFRARGEHRHVGDVAIVEQRVQARPGVRPGQRLHIRGGGQRETVRHAHAGVTQGAIQFAQRCVLAADERHISSRMLSNQRVCFDEEVMAEHPLSNFFRQLASAAGSPH